MESAMESQAAPPPESEDPQNAETEDDVLLSKAQKLMAKITSSPANPNPNVLHSLASMLETQESRYVQDLGQSSFNNGRASHNIGKLGSAVRENDEFFELISSKFLSESRYSVSVRSAAARVLLSCSTTWMYPHVFEDAVLENIKQWVMDDAARVSGDECNGKLKLRRNKSFDSDMFRTYATGLLALALDGGGQVVEDVLTSGLSAKLMRYLRTRVLGETNTSQKDISYLSESKHASGPTCVRSREESRSRFRQVLDATHVDGPRTGDDGVLDDHNAERDHDRSISIRQVRGEECWVDGEESLKSREFADGSTEVVGMYEVDGEDVDLIGEDRGVGDLRDGKAKVGDRFGMNRPMRDEDADENVRDESTRRRAIRGWARMRGKGRIHEGVAENERTLASPGTGLRSGGQGRSIRDRNLSKNADIKRLPDAKKYPSGTADDVSAIEREDNDDRFIECKVGTKDISDLVKKATRAAEAEARAANAPAEAIKAAGDAAAELVKTAALEALKNTNDEEAAVLAASEAASTVVDAAMAIEVSSSKDVNADSSSSKAFEPEVDEELEEFFVLDDESLAQLREKYCIQCLVILGEYVEVLGPVLHEKGVDVCLALLQRSSKQKESSETFILLPDVLKLICALAAHRKFAALFVDRGGMQKFLAVQRDSQTFFGLSSCLLTIGSLQGIMERVCALPSDVVHQVVELALQLLECPQDPARKNAAIFFASAFVFRAVLDSFDAQDGLQKMLNLLHGAASVRSGSNSGTLGPSNLGSLRNDRSPAEVLTASEKQIAYHTCVALRQYFRAHLLLLVDSLRPNKSNRSGARNVSSARAAYKPLDISNEAMEAVFVQIQRDRKLGPLFVRARWPAVDKFLASNGHIIMLELCQAPPDERYLHDLAQYALGVLHIVTLFPSSRKLIVNATLSNERVGMAVILDAANGAGYVDPEVIHPALNVLANLVCPPPSISNKPPVLAQGQQSVSVQTLNGHATDNRERNADRNISDRNASLPTQNESRERNGEPSGVERGSSVVPAVGNSSQTAVPTIAPAVVGDRRISLGPGAGCAGLAAQLEQGYRQARDAVRANNGIKVLLHLLHPRIFTPPASLDCLRALACRVLLGLARDNTIAHILTKLQVGKKLSELIRDSGSQVSGTEQGRWQAELAQVAIELIAIVTNSGRASTLAATDAAAPTLRRIERAAIAAATPISYHSRELLLLIHEHLQASGLTTTATSLLKEAQLTPLPSLASPHPLPYQASVQETSSLQIQWPSGRAPCEFLSDASKITPRDENTNVRNDLTVSCSKKKPLVFSSSVSSQGKSQLSSQPSSVVKLSSASKNPSAAVGTSENPASSVFRPNSDTDLPFKTPIVLPLKRKLMDRDNGCASPVSMKRLATADVGFQSPVCQTPNTARKSSQPMDGVGISVTPSSNLRDPFGRSTPCCILVDNLDDVQYNSTPGGQMTPSAFQLGLVADPQAGNIERVTLDSLVVQYLKHQHRQCPAPITTLPPLSLLHPHVCPEPSRNFDAPTNVTSRLSMREFRNLYGGIRGHRKDRQFVYSRFRPWRTCRDDVAPLSCITFLGDFTRIATGSHSGELKIFDSNSGNVLENHSCCQSPITLLQSALSGDTQLLLSSGAHDVRLWDAYSVSGGPMHSFERCKSARFSHSGAMFAALSAEAEPSRREVLLYDIQTCNLELKLSDTSTTPAGTVRGHAQSLIHFSPSDTMLLWNGVLWDRRVSRSVHRFDQFTDYGGGGFHPAGNEVIINSEVWDLRKFKLLRSVPSLDQTVITFNGAGDVIYAILRRNLEDIASAVHTRRVRHPLFAAFRTVDAVTYTDIATIPVDRCVLDFAVEPTDSFVGLVSMDDHDDLFSSARLYEIGRRRPTNDDSDPDDGVDTDDEDDEDDDSEADEDPTLGLDLDSNIDSDAEDLSNDDDDDSADELDDDDGDFNIDDVGFEGGPGILEIMTEGDDDDDSQVVDSFSSEDEGDYSGHGFGF
ncbi:DDB1- and CUL4-associated factor homolog 1 isoform X2 [Magnolia sinica]|uniref:DDB1- and CUL4-associated factor homolog 1 isoform X2 n=1 Tax=Magnolia sinica TaxID=86752 RepID=UPI0026589E77|nr:DDB1- and CUL4-associated factor homolog 1 isoform X2 [Magnolia sinica]